MQETLQKVERTEETKINTEMRHLFISWAIMFIVTYDRFRRNNHTVICKKCNVTRNRPDEPATQQACIELFLYLFILFIYSFIQSFLLYL
jgi:hypothetical protein